MNQRSPSLAQLPAGRAANSRFARPSGAKKKRLAHRETYTRLQ